MASAGYSGSVQLLRQVLSEGPLSMFPVDPSSFAGGFWAQSFHWKQGILKGKEMVRAQKGHKKNMVSS